MNTTIKIEEKTYEVDPAVASAVAEMQTEIETLCSALTRLASFVGGDPCWCKCEGGEHSEICSEIRNLPIWERPHSTRRRYKRLPWKDSETVGKTMRSKRG